MDYYKHFTSCRVYSTVRQEEDEASWLAARTKGIGGSDIGAICGVSPFSSARQIYLSKTGQYEESTQPNPAAIERMRFGHLLEPIVADEYARRELPTLHPGAKLVSLGATMQHSTYQWAFANIDRLIVDENDIPVGVLECKTTGEYNNEDWENGNLLLSYLYQLNWYLWILDLKWGAFACLVGGNKFYSYEVFRDDMLIKNVLIPAAQKFWVDNVLALKEPEMQSSDTEFANGLYSTVVKNSETVFKDDETNDLALTVMDCKAKIKELTGIMEEAQNRIKDRLKDTEIGYTKDCTIKWSPRSQMRVDTDRLKAEFPDVYLSCLKKIEFRAMTVRGGL